MTVSLTKEEASSLPIIMDVGIEGLEEDDKLVVIVKGIKEKLKLAETKESLKKVTRRLNKTN